MRTHGIQWRGTYRDETGGPVVHAYDYGELRNVLRDKSCSYSYREFWV